MNHQIFLFVFALIRWTSAQSISVLSLQKPCPPTPITNTTAVDGVQGLLSSDQWQFQIVTCTFGTFPSGLTYQGFICNVFTGIWSPDPAKTFCGGGTACAATAVKNTPGLQSSTTAGGTQTIQCNSAALTFPNGQSSNTFTCTKGAWGPQNPWAFACTQPAPIPTTCPAMPIANTAGLQSSTAAGGTQTIQCTSATSTFPNGQNSNTFICTNGVWGPQNPSTFTCTQPAATPGSSH